MRERGETEMGGNGAGSTILAISWSDNGGETG